MTYVKVFILQFLVASQSDAQKEGDLRLSDGIGSTDGRLELYHDGRWGTICNSWFNEKETIVACKQLTNRTTKAYHYDAAVGKTGTTWELGFEWNSGCNGTELRLQNCRDYQPGPTNRSWCRRYIIGVGCDIPDEGDLRLANGNNSLEGRLEIYHNGRWGTVCNDTFGRAEALVACKQLTHRNKNVKEASAYTAGDGNGTIWMNKLRCRGEEWKLKKCFHGEWGNHNCSHDRDVGIRCLIDQEGELRLSGEMNMDGFRRLEINHDGIWGTICRFRFDWLDARVFCQQILNGFNTRTFFSEVYGKPCKGSGKIWLSNLTCSGDEFRLNNCSHSKWGSHNCTHNYDVCMKCAREPEYGSWGPRFIREPCSTACGYGSLIERGYCNNPSPSPGGDCAGDSSKIVICERRNCTGNTEEIARNIVLCTVGTVLCLVIGNYAICKLDHFIKVKRTVTVQISDRYLEELLGRKGLQKESVDLSSTPKEQTDLIEELRNIQ